MKKILLLLFFLFLSSCQAKEKTSAISIDFESLMGKNSSAWNYIASDEDDSALNFFKALYEKNIPLLTGGLDTDSTSSQPIIPKVLHFIWVGPREFPKESATNVSSWIDKHPGWTVYFWTDRTRAVPHPAMQRRRIEDIGQGRLTPFYDKTTIYAEKADLLRYEILYQYGGVYVDHDMKCLKSFDAFNAAYDLFCGLEMPFETPLSSSVLPTNNLIGAKPGHPILNLCIDKVCSRWDAIEKKYPGHHRDDVMHRVVHRTFSSFGESVKEYANKEGNNDMVFPAFFFNAPKEAFSIFAHHQYTGTWFENETKFEKSTRERLMYLSKKTNKILLACTIMTVLNLTLFMFLILIINKKKIIKN